VCGNGIIGPDRVGSNRAFARRSNQVRKLDRRDDFSRLRHVNSPLDIAPHGAEHFVPIGFGSATRRRRSAAFAFS
jgi:hypothetical protein